MTSEQTVQWVEVHRANLLAHAKRRLGNYADAEDAVQELQMRVFKSPPPPDTPNLPAWFYCTLNWVCLDILRKRRRYKTLLEKVFEKLRKQHGKIDDIDFEPCLRKLKTDHPREYEVLMLIWEQVPPSEIAQRKRITVNAVYILFHKGTQRLKECLEKQLGLLNRAEL